ncbi:retrotransposon protein, putative, ty1-copia subclass [Tanacetum coccineum]
MFQQQAEQELFKTVKAFHACKQEEGQSVSTYVYDQFMQNYNMNSMGKTIPELHAMLKLLEKSIPKKALAVLSIRQGKIQNLNHKHEERERKEAREKASWLMTPSTRSPPPAKKEHPAKDTECHHCHKTRHWKRNYPLYLAELKKNKASTFGTSSIFTIELATVEAIESFDLILPSGMILKRIAKLQHDGLLESIDDESFDVCVSCISGKMARKPFTFASERADALLGIIHSDVCGPFRTTSREGEYLSQEFLDHLRSHGIISQLTPPYTPQHNGVSERRIRTLLDIVRSMMSLTTLPMSFWGYALDSAARILNMVLTKKVNKTPYEMWHEKVPNLSYLKVWGCEALVKRDTPNKLESKSIKCILVGYPKEKIGYYFYYPLENKIFVAREDAQPSDNTSQHQPEVEHDDVDPQTDVIPVRRSARIPQAPERYGFYIDAEEHELGDHGEPPNYRAALSDLESEKWLEAMNVEMQSMKDNQVWNLVDLPPNCKTVGSKWLFKKKTDMDGNIHTYKARLVAKGFTQTYGFDYEETFSPVADIKAIRILIAIAAYYDYEIWQMDVNTAFLNGRLNEDVYVVQLEGFVNPKHPGRVCKLQRSIYGLKQASRIWNKRFDEEIKKYGFTQNPDEPCVYKKASGSIIVFLILYVDDILIMGNNILMLQNVKSWLGKCFAMKDLGEASYILRITIYQDRSRRLIGLSQNAYIDKILKRFKINTSKRGTIPMQPNVDLSKSQGHSTSAEVKRMKGIPYASAIGSIMYAVRCTRPNVAITKDMFLVYGGDSITELSATCYTDASWETDRDDLRS